MSVLATLRTRPAQFQILGALVWVGCWMTPFWTIQWISFAFAVFFLTWKISQSWPKSWRFFWAQYLLEYKLFKLTTNSKFRFLALTVGFFCTLVITSALFFGVLAIAQSYFVLMDSFILTPNLAIFLKTGLILNATALFLCDMIKSIFSNIKRLNHSIPEYQEERIILNQTHQKIEIEHLKKSLNQKIPNSKNKITPPPRL